MRLSILEIVRRRFPDCEVWLVSYAPFINEIIIRYEEGKKFNDDGVPNSGWFWHEYGILVDSDEQKIDEEEFLDKLEDFATTRKQYLTEIKRMTAGIGE